MEGTHKKSYTFEEICPCPFDSSMLVSPYPPGFEIPKFYKYKGKGDPREHVRKFYMACQEVSYSDVYLRRLFSKSLSGHALAWFTTLPHGSMTSFPDLVEKFVAHYEYNIENDASMVDLSNAQKRNGETFSKFLQTWLHLIRKFPWDIPKSYRVELFLRNLIPKMSYHLSCQCLERFEEVTKKGLALEIFLL